MVDSTVMQSGRYKAYPEYKDSGVEWLGDIPSGWEMWKLAHAYESIGSGTTPPTNDENAFDGDIPWITTGELREKVILDTSKKVSNRTLKKYSALKKHPAGSIAIAMYGATIGRLGILGVEATTNQACCVLSNSNTLLNKFLFYWLQAFKEDIVRLSSGGGQPNINQEKVASLKVSTPSLEEQVKIASFLDYETAKIDTLIQKQQRLIELLTEKRQAVISHAVTKGLNPDVPMKDLGVEWLGEVPEHWNITKIKYIAELTPSKSEALSHLGGKCSFVPMEKLKRDSLILDETRDVKDVHQGYTYFRDNDILLAKVTPCFENQNIAVAKNLVNGIGFGSSEIFVLRTNNIKLNYFMFYRLQENIFMQMGVGAMTGAGGLQRVPTDFINNFQFALPPLKEAQQIVNYLRDQNKRFDILISKANQQIQLMQERRTALISAAVTGKIDVRDWVKPE